MRLLDFWKSGVYNLDKEKQMRPPFVPTHRLKEEMYSMPKGTLLRQNNPYADDRSSVRYCYTQDEWDRGSRDPWLLVSDELEELSEWQAIRQEMIERMNKR
jgi:hypothetical protein